MSHPEIEAIYPLTSMQHALLVHHLLETTDQGLLHVQCTLTGNLDRGLFEKAWEETVNRHSALRTSIHWQDIEQPVQIVHKASKMPLSIEDWIGVSDKNQKLKFAELKKITYAQGLDLSAAPVSRITLAQVSKDRHLFLWNCHHILLDGWSVPVILTDVFTYYDSLRKGTMPRLETIHSYASYTEWIRQKDLTLSKSYWNDVLHKFKSPGAITNSCNTDISSTDSSFSDHEIVLNDQVTKDLNHYARTNHVSFSVVMQAIWGLLLARYFDTMDVTYGLTVSGRSGAIPNMELMAGLFANVIPLRVGHEPDMTIPELLKHLHRNHIEAHDHMYVSIDQIKSWIGWKSHAPIFDTLLVIENIPWEGMKGGELLVEGFEGTITSTYPLTAVAKPGVQCEVLLRYDQNRLSQNSIDWFSKYIEILARHITSQDAVDVNTALSLVDNPIGPNRTDEIEEGLSSKNLLRNRKGVRYVAPLDDAELEMTRIWEDVLGFQPIGVTDNFFELGGKSIQAVQLVSQVETRLRKNIPPTIILQHPTIREMARIVYGDTQKAKWSSLVPIRASGSELPVFCIHAGGAHVFFYEPLAHYLGPDQPVYGLQPVGLDGAEFKHQSIEEMADYYVDVIRQVQPEGPYTLVSTCLGIAVTLEMGKILVRSGQPISALVMVDTAPPKSLTLNKQFSPIRFLNALSKGQWNQISLKINGVVEQIQHNVTRVLGDSQSRNIERMRIHLFELYRRYQWTPFEGKVTFIRSVESKENLDYDYQIDNWSAMALGGLDVHIIPGHHRTIFDDPEVRGLAVQVTKCLKINQFEKI